MKVIYNTMRSLFWGLVNSALRRDPRLLFSSVISFYLPKSVHLPHPVGIVIGKGVTFGDNVIIMQNVTIGVARLGESKAPRIGSNVLIGAGAVVVGDIYIPDNTVIRANAVVTS